MSSTGVRDFAERLRHHDGLADELPWPPGLPRHRLACDVLERALRLHGAAYACLDAVIAVRRSLADPAALAAIAERMWDQVPYRGLYPAVSREPTWESLPAWAAASVADPRFYDGAFADAVRIAARAASDAAKEAVLAAGRAGPVADAPAIAWQAALELPSRSGISPHPADAVRAQAFGAPAADWQDALYHRAWEAERAWQNWWLASAIQD